MVNKHAGLLLSLVLAIVSGCTGGHPPAPVAGHHGQESAAIPGAVESLDVYADHSVLHVLYAKRLGDDETTPITVWHSSSANGGALWSPPIRVDMGCGAPHAPHRGMDVQIAASGNHLVAAWQTAGTDPWGGGPMATAVSDNGGKSWHPGVNPVDDGLTTGHGFIDIAADSAGTFHLVWLDSRHGKQGLRYTRSADYGKTWQTNVTLDDETCECCWNSLVAGPDKTIGVLYRDKSPRDMAFMLSKDGGATWERTGSVGSFNWEFNGCPHVGGSAVFSKNNLHALVWTGHDDIAGLYDLVSTNQGHAWSDPHLFTEKGARRSDLALRPDGVLAACWESSAKKGTAIFAATSRNQGKTWSRPKQLSAPNVLAAYPRIVPTGAGFQVFWTESRGTNWCSAPIDIH